MSASTLGHRSRASGGPCVRKISAWVVSNKNAVVFLVTLASVLFLHGAVPFVAVPTLGQAVYAAGFGQSFVNESMLTIHANNFGMPKPTVIVLGLMGAYPVGFLIGRGFHQADAYASMAGMCLTVAFLGAWHLRQLLALLAAFLADLLAFNRKLFDEVRHLLRKGCNKE